jgi:hypothetical protein
VDGRVAAGFDLHITDRRDERRRRDRNDRRIAGDRGDGAGERADIRGERRRSTMARTGLATREPKKYRFPLFRFGQMRPGTEPECGIHRSTEGQFTPASATAEQARQQSVAVLGRVLLMETASASRHAEGRLAEPPSRVPRS